MRFSRSFPLFLTLLTLGATASAQSVAACPNGQCSRATSFYMPQWAQQTYAAPARQTYAPPQPVHYYYSNPAPTYAPPQPTYYPASQPVRQLQTWQYAAPYTVPVQSTCVNGACTAPAVRR